MNTDTEDIKTPFVTEPPCKCESCKLARFESHKLYPSVIHRYYYKPRHWNFKSLRNDKYGYFLGVELETDNYDRSEGSKSKVTKAMAASMRRPKYFWTVKRDASITGPEFVSHPATLSYWKSLQETLNEMFEMLLHAGYRSYTNDTCGMHINISFNAFKSSVHLYRFLTLIHFSENFSKKMSQRTYSSLRDWANLGYMSNPVRRKEICKYVLKDSSVYLPDRHIAVNIPSYERRFEFRLPRGTLRVDRFFKNLEWTVAMIEFTRNRYLKNTTPAKFVEWVKKNEAEFPNLVAFINEKFPSNVSLDAY